MAPNPRAYLLRYAELALKGRNRHIFVDDLMKILRPRIAPLGGVLKRRHKKLILETSAEPERVRRALSQVYGLSGVSPIWRTANQLEDLIDLGWRLLEPHNGSGQTFAVKVKRANKRFPHGSTETQKLIADGLRRHGLDLPVNLKQPDLCLGVTIDFDCANVFLETWPGCGGLPVSAVSKHALLLSGGIDSPVAGSLIQKRGGRLMAIYFHTPPFTVEAAKEKAISLAEVLARWQNDLDLLVVNFTETMKAIRAECDPAYTVLLSRRMMMRIADILARKADAKSLITGESLGQVASQTIENIGVINECASLPVLRPLIGFDKREIIDIAVALGSYEISIQPFDDCCALFSSKDPITRCKPDFVRREENKLGVEALVASALDRVETFPLTAQFAF